MTAPGGGTGQPDGTGIISASKSAETGSTAESARSRAAAAPGPGSTGSPANPALSVPATSVPGGRDRAPKDPVPGNVLSFPEPPARRRRRIFIVTAAIVAALMAAVTAAAVYSPVLALRTITVDGTKMLGAAQVQAALEPLQGRPLPQISDEEVSALLQPLVQIRAATVQARPPSALHIQIVERAPVALVRQGDTFQLVDVDGVQLSTITDPASMSLPVIEGGGGTLPKDLFQAITAVLGALPADVLARLSDAKAKSVDAVELRLVDGQTILWGNAGEKELKARVLAALLKVPPDPKNPVRTYDVSVPRHPVTR